MDLSNFHPTQIVELPAILNHGRVEMLTPDLLKLPEQNLREIAKVMTGELVYIKMRAVYSEVEGRQFCVRKDCWRPVVKDTDWCSDHPHEDH